MIGYIKGKLLEVENNQLIITVGGAVGPAHEGCVGYAVTVPGEASYVALVVGSEVEFFIYTHVREDALELFGFLTRLEKSLFLTLLQVNGIGPKSALGILSGASPADLLRAIMDGDKAFLTRVPGIGKKTAERVVLELSDPIKKKFQAGFFGQHMVKTVHAAADLFVDSKLSRQMVEAQAALIALGLKDFEATELLEKARALKGENEKPLETQALIRFALREINRGK